MELIHIIFDIDNNMEVLIVWLNPTGKIRLLKTGESLSSASLEDLRKFSCFIKIFNL